MKSISTCTVCGTEIKGTSLTCPNGCVWNKEDQSTIENHIEIKKAFKSLIYDLEGFSEEYGSRNFGDAESWMRHVYNSYKKYSDLKEEMEDM